MLANKHHYNNHPNLDFNAFHIPVDVKHLRYNMLESQHKQTKKAHRGAQAHLDFDHSC